jgi:hypothetical protein
MKIPAPLPTVPSRPAPRPKRSRWRFSLRMLLLAMAVIGGLLAAVLAPILHEVRQAAEFTRQTNKLQDAGYGYWPGQRKDSYSLWLTRHLWPARVQNLGQQITALQVNANRTRDLAKLPHIATVSEWRFAYGSVVCADARFEQPRIRSITYEQANALDPPRDPDIHLLTHFPNVENVRIWHVPADTHVLHDLRSCTKLRRLEIYLDARWVNGPMSREALPLDVVPLRGLQQVEELQILRLPPEVDWSFLAEMTALREVEINPHGMTTPGAIYSFSIRRPAEARESTPLFQLARLKNLRRVELQSTPAYAADLELLAQKSPIEHLQLEHMPEGATALAGLRHAKGLRSLHLKISQFEDLRALEDELQQLPQLRELSCDFRELNLAHVQLLTQLKQIESLRITFVDKYNAGPGGRVLLAALPLHEFRASYEWTPPGIPPSDAQKLAALAAQKRRAYEQASESR